MTASSHPIPNGTSGRSRLQMEQCIDRLAEASRTGVHPSKFFSEVLGSALNTGGARQACLWCRSVEGAWQLAGEVPVESQFDDDFIRGRQTLLDEVSQSVGPYQLSGSSGVQRTEAEPETRANSRILSPIRHAATTVGVLETIHDVDATGQLPDDTLAFISALCEITADYLSQQELEQLRNSRQIWQEWDQFAQSLWRSLDLSTVCGVIANDGRLLVNSDRISVLVRQGRSFRLNAVSGVVTIEPRASVTRTLESLATLTARHNRAIWRHATDHAPPNAVDPDLGQILQQYMKDSGEAGIGIIPIAGNEPGTNPASIVAVLVLETFRSIEDTSAWKARGELLAGRCRPVLKAAIERSEIPWFQLWQRLRQLPGLWLSPMTMAILAIFVILATALMVIPAEFTVSGSAELWPAKRRDVFATASGIVDRVMTAHGDQVRQGQPLIILRDPELESDAPRILGEIAMVNERLKGVQAARFIGDHSPDLSSRSRQLTADEEELKERLQTLERQRVLIEERLNQLTLCSPIDGTVLTWDVDQLLSARPVERGQTLITVGDTSGPWIVEVLVADKDAGHVLRARKNRESVMKVDFLLPSEPGRTYHGRVQEVSLSTESDEHSHGHIRVVVAIDGETILQPRAGATAIPRLHCGRRSLGYVWLHDLIDAIRNRILF